MGARLRWFVSCEFPTFQDVVTRSRHAAFLSSGLVELTAAAVETLPAGPALFRLRAPGQRVVYIGWAGERGLREAVRSFQIARPVAGISTVEYSPAESPEAARQMAEADICNLKPLYNEGFGRYRNAETEIPTSGRRTRRAMHNP